MGIGGGLSLFPYPYCCLCFVELTERNIVIILGEKWDCCLQCEPRVFRPEEYDEKGACNEPKIVTD